MPLLRGHHMICLHFFNGEGYDEKFIDNLREVLRQAGEEEVTVSSGADDVCASCTWLKEGRCHYEEGADKAIQEMDAKALALLSLSHGEMVKWVTIESRVNEIFSDWFSKYCMECDWRGACEKSTFFLQLSEKRLKKRIRGGQGSRMLMKKHKNSQKKRRI